MLLLWSHGSALQTRGPSRPTPAAGRCSRHFCLEGTDLQKEVLVRPDGGFTFPLAGEVTLMGIGRRGPKPSLPRRLKRYVPTPVVTVAVKAIGGTVLRAGQGQSRWRIPFSTFLRCDAGDQPRRGHHSFAALNDIVILRRQNGRQEHSLFNYSDVSTWSGTCTEHPAAERRHGGRSVDQRVGWCASGY